MSDKNATGKHPAPASHAPFFAGLTFEQQEVILETALDVFVNQHRFEKEEVETFHKLSAYWFQESPPAETHVVLTKEEHRELQEQDLFVTALENTGVDNWSGWEFAHEAYESLKEEYLDD